MRTPGFGANRFSSTRGVCPIAWTMSPYLPPQGRFSSPGSTTSKSVARGSGRLNRLSAGHRRQDHQRVRVGERRVEAVEHAHVLVVLVDVHVPVQLAALPEEL